MENLNTKVDEIKTSAENLTEHATAYFETYIKLAVVNATQKATGIATVSLTAILLSFFCVFVLLFSGAGAAVWIGERLGNMEAGFFCVAGFYLICAAFFLLLRKNFISPFVRNHIIKKVYE